MRITAKGQVTIPQYIRDRLGLLPGTEVDLEIDGDGVRLTKAADSTSRGKRLVRHMSGRLAGGMTTEELMLLTRGPFDDPGDADPDTGNGDMDGNVTDRP